MMLRPIILFLALSTVALGNEWQTIRNCQLLDHPSNDGDSFHVEANGEERIFRLYYVDTPEAETGGLVTERVAQQATEFGVSEEEIVEIGKKASAFTKAVLSRPFVVKTRGQNALGRSKLKREYAFVETADGEDLGEMLIAQGLARSHGQDAKTPTQSATSLRQKYDRLEAKARREGVGAWGDGAATPTMELSVGDQSNTDSATSTGNDRSGQKSSE